MISLKAQLSHIFESGPYKYSTAASNHARINWDSLTQPQSPLSFQDHFGQITFHLNLFLESIQNLVLIQEWPQLLPCAFGRKFEPLESKRLIFLLELEASERLNFVDENPTLANNFRTFLVSNL